MSAQGQSYLESGQWQATLAHRWVHSDRHFVGGVEQPQRQAAGTEVVNDVQTFDLMATYAPTRRLAATLAVPFVHADRASLYEHDGVRRHHMTAGGLGDVRLTAACWLLDPDRHPNGNFSLGLGVKAPTGEENATAVAYRATGPVVRPVDQSIQPGDGGWGILFEASGFQKLLPHTYAYMTATYLANPRGTSGTETTTSRPAIDPNRVTYLSVSDAYLLRAGLSYSIWPSKGLALTLGGRLEGVPVEDWFGNSEGFRRPGYAVSLEPGVTWTYKRLSLTVTAPIALECNRERSVSDLRTGRHGDAAFADYLITSSLAYRF